MVLFEGLRAIFHMAKSYQPSLYRTLRQLVIFEGLRAIFQGAIAQKWAKSQRHSLQSIIYLLFYNYVILLCIYYFIIMLFAHYFVILLFPLFYLLIFIYTCAIYINMNIIAHHIQVMFPDIGPELKPKLSPELIPTSTLNLVLN